MCESTICKCSDPLSCMTSIRHWIFFLFLRSWLSVVAKAMVVAKAIGAQTTHVSMEWLMYVCWLKSALWEGFAAPIAKPVPVLLVRRLQCRGILKIILWSEWRCCVFSSSSSSFAFPSYISGVHHFWVRFLRMWPFFNPTIKVLTFRLRGWCVLGVFLLPAFTRLGHERQDLLSPCDEMYVCTD